MYYKRITDLHQPGVPNGSNWNEIKESGPNGESIQNVISPTAAVANYDVPNNLVNYSIPTSVLSPNMMGIHDAFENLEWWQNSQAAAINYEKVSFDTQSESEEIEAETEYYPKALWFEVAIAKKPNGESTAASIAKYQSKRMNAYNFINSTFTELSTAIFSAEYMLVNSLLRSNELSSKVADIDSIKIDVLRTGYADIISTNAQSITANAISSNIGCISNITGENIYFKNIDPIAEFFSTDLSANDGNVGNKSYSENFHSNGGEVSDLSSTCLTAFRYARLKAVNADNSGMAEFFKSNATYDAGTLVRFGTASESSSDWEITLADISANGIVANYDYENGYCPGLTMNYKAKERDNSFIPVVLCGRTKVKVYGNVDRFDNLYPCQTSGYNGYACNEPYGQKIGIAMESSSETTALIDCITKFNLK